MDFLTPTNIVSSFFFNIYLVPLDRYIKDLANQCNKGTKFKENTEYIKNITFLKNKITNMSQFEIHLEKIKFRRLTKDLSKKINDQNIIRIKYVRYADDFIIGRISVF